MIANPFDKILECKILLYPKKWILFRIISRNYQIILLMHSTILVIKRFTNTKLDLLP